ncbi:TDP-N-acetylfucosamine:lipid II N-acetylfucosaminyltransferase [Arenibacter lacus]|uniref:TDP-N-acetylfucosamine:lipid II N-acetylfucosaminyltransferase n=1 Tax=Arenibacter lacus TaxID=2608629 RepID=UPI00123E3A61|nr:TDP-N-acetylfucosamine:lipid II N-acetylfucosaminyltransferase [Arenibacter lacus]
MKILHIAPDEKFINNIYFQFNKLFPNQNKFLILLEKNVETTRYVSINDNFSTVTMLKKNVRYCIKESTHYDIIIIHGLNYFQSQIVLNVGNINKFIWFFWGGEIYDNTSALGNKVIGEVTFQKFHLKSWKDHLKSLIRIPYYFIRYKTRIPEKEIIRAAKKIKQFGILHREELEYFKQLGYLSPIVSHICMTYYPLEYIFKGIESTKINGNNILLGNSASSSNNHLEAFNILKSFNLNDKKLFVPLSYGDKRYGETINEIGHSLFGENFQSLFDFMPLEKYTLLLSSCNIVIMNHYRQQAVGNIIAMLWMGAKVYLDERNTFYHYLRRIGVEVFSIDVDLKLENPLALEGLSDSEINQNREILLREIGFSNVKTQLEHSLKLIVGEH